MKRKLASSGAYDRCLECAHFGTSCDGPRTSSMRSHERWCEFMRAVKELRGLTNEYVAEVSGVSLGTVSRIMAGSVEKDLRWSTVQAIENTLIGSSGRFPCSLAAHDPDAIAHAELKDTQLKELQRVLSGIHESYREEIGRVREDAAREIELYKEKIAALETQISELKTLVVTRGRMMEKLIDKS